MDQKILKTPIYVNETVFEQSLQLPLDVDFTMPDYCPDIVKLLKCRAVARISTKSISSGNINLEGCVTITALYSDEKKMLCSYEYQFPFSKTIESGKNLDNAELCCNVRCDYINYRALTSRKIDIHGAIGITLKAKSRKCTEVISDFDDATTELRRTTAPAISPIGYSEKYIVLEDEIETGPGQPTVRSILRYDADTIIKETKIISGKVMIKGEMPVTLLYCDEKGEVQSVKSSFGFSQLLDVEGINESCECESVAEIVFLDIKPKFSSGDGEERAFRMNAKLLISCKAFCKNDIDVICDAFPRKYETSIAKCDVCFDRVTRNINENFSCKKKLDFTDNSLCEIIDMWCDTETKTVSIENNRLSVLGTLTACIISTDDDKAPCYHEKNVDFEYSLDLNSIEGLPHCEPKLSVVSCGYTLNGNSSMELRAEIAVNASIYECCKMPIVTSINIDKNKPISIDNDSALTICFALKGESVWDIAEKYHACVDDIIKINDLDNEQVDDSKMLLIPC